MKLFCLPYAGGSKTAYYKWKEVLNNNIQLEAIELKGRGTRYGEGFYTDFDDAVNDIYINIKNKIIDDDYAIFGHSMGSLLAFELYYKIVENGGRIPKHIFFSGYKDPDCARKEEPIYNLPDDEFMNEVIKLGGMPIEVLENKELCQLVTQILKNDFKILELYKYRQRNDTIKCDTTILNGSEDTITFEEVYGWKKYCLKNVRILTFEGDHFFINNNMNKIIKLIEHTLLKF
ncbi:thioesterase II family protein [Clostridium estertheticum]|uniref:thioesterase II family protein n=1 Tax=Clostridium estertheticum TaxID=238834 RepID=UPI001C6E29E8|nr:thioesterase domain-containing protein [Clostridium estertheticum]MBW9154569.1 thioesterase [Clostridium estertheticum]WLC83810.1 thioesterase [Clostridium estertheticum]